MLIFLETREIQNRRQEEFCEFSEATRLCQLGGPLHKRTAVSHSSIEAEVNFFNAGLRLDGIPALGLWYIVIDVLGPPAPGNLMRHPKKQQQKSKNNTVKQAIEDLDFVRPNAHTSSQRASLFSFEEKTMKRPRSCH